MSVHLTEGRKITDVGFELFKKKILQNLES